MRIVGVTRVGQEQSQQTAKGAGIPMVVGIRGQQQEADGQHHKGCNSPMSLAPSSK
jgi:hypothetical protein